MDLMVNASYIVPCSLVYRYRRFGGTCCLHVQDINITIYATTPFYLRRL